jgi:hypothetical protein
MIDCEFDVRAYEEGYRAGKHDAQVEIDRLRAALEIAANDLNHCGACTDADNARAALGGDK